jgi:hypothetical protein
LRIRIQRELREKFLAACREKDRPAAEVLRNFMRAFIAGNAGSTVRQGAAKPTARRSK